MENLSEKFKEHHIPKFEKGKNYTFRLIGLKKNPAMGNIEYPSYKNIISSDVIFDPYNGSNGNPVSIEFVKQIVNAPVNSQRDTQKILGKIVFKRDQFGEIRLNGSNPGDKKLFEYLFLCNSNKSNINKPWHIKPSRGYKYELLDAETKSLDKTTLKRKIHTATGIALNLEESKLRIVSEQLGKSEGADFKYSPALSENVLRDRLIAYAEKYPDRVIVLNEEYSLSVRELIKDALSQSVITIDKAKGQILWTKGMSVICIIPPNQDAEEVLISYFLTTDGSRVLEMLMNQLGEDDEDVKIVKAGSEDLENLRNEYEALTGKKPHHKLSIESLREKIEELSMA